jgi:hypothetical protein
MAKTRGRNQALGLELVSVDMNQLDQLLAGELENAISHGSVAVEHIAGPVQNEDVSEF